MRGVIPGIKSILLVSGIALLLSACAVYAPPPRPYYAGYAYYPPAPAVVYPAPGVYVGGGWHEGGGWHHWR
ncbi:hypothetical protein [Telmatospirillum sp.]|uniref:hypothetical protein n=1 Tax=Telmatospirillum sp. TaxID=2079197 RepID=UPI00283BA184|nr:hypothetical protein [Telmatospirillum sp.]MDR3438876.1 hypothetical protein [Telmatospirillum sp.]